MIDYVEKYKDEIEILKTKYNNSDPDDVIAFDVNIAIKTIEKYVWGKYDPNEHFPAVIELVMNKTNKDKDGLTNVARGMLTPKLRIL